MSERGGNRVTRLLGVEVQGERVRVKGFGFVNKSERVRVRGLQG